jgi:hypothetical protein
MWQGDESDWALLLGSLAACDALCRCCLGPAGGRVTVRERAGETCERQRKRHFNTITAIRAALDEMLDVRQMVIVPLTPRCLKFHP